MKFLRYLHLFLCFICAVLIILFKTTYALMIVFFSYFLLLLYAFGIPLICIAYPNQLLSTPLSWHTILFLVLTIGAILSVYGTKIIHRLIRKYSPLKDWGEHKYQAVQIKLALYILNKSNTNFLLYAIYFIYLTLSGFLQIQYQRPLISTDIDNAILKSFLVFMAFSSMLQQAKKVQFKLKELFSQMVALVTTHDDI